MTAQALIDFAPAAHHRRLHRQARQILAHLEAGWSITPAEALHLFGSTRLAARINEINAELAAQKRPLVLREIVTLPGGREIRPVLPGGSTLTARRGVIIIWMLTESVDVLLVISPSVVGCARAPEQNPPIL